MSMLSDDSDTDSCTETWDSEDQESESAYGGNARSILSSLDESIEKINEFLAYERGFSIGDIVCSVTDPSGQLGRVVDIDMVVDLESRLGHVVKDVNSKNLEKIRSIASGDDVVQGPWLGRVQTVQDDVTIAFSDGARCAVMTGDSEIIIPVCPQLFEEAPYPYYQGQRVRIKPHETKSVKWLSDSSNSVHNEGTICNVEVGLVHVNWIASVMINCAASPPPALQKPKDIKLLLCFPHANWQLGDWGTLRSENFNNLQIQTSGMDDSYWKQMYVVTKTKTKVDILWQDGRCSVALDSQSLLPVNNIGDHDFWPGQFVLEKAASDDLDAQTGPRLGIVKSVDAQDRTVKVKWKVLEGEACEEVVSAYELTEHLDFTYSVSDIVFRDMLQYEKLEGIPHAARFSELKQGHDLYVDKEFIGSNFLVKAEDHINKDRANDAYLSCIGNVIGFKDEGVEVKWATGETSKVLPNEIFGLDRLGDPVSISEVVQESAPKYLGEETTNENGKFRLEKEMDANSTEACEEDEWHISSVLFPCASIGFFKSITSTLFASGASTSLLSLWKGPKFQVLKSEEAHLEGKDTEPVSLKQQVEEAAIQGNLPPSLGNEKTGTFKRFDSVDDYSDHHFVNSNVKGTTGQMRRGWLNKVQQEWSILEKDLPDSISVRVYEERVDLLRACIVGASGTPYHDALFFFDVFFPPDYPHEPPMVHYNSGGLRLNPNLYESGRVCLSLLNTWTGTGTEAWDPRSSTILQVLLSLQALVLNDKPYFNEAGYDKQMGKAEGERNSITYNENAFLLSCKSMLYLLCKPPKHFEEFVKEHFTRRSHHILLACEAYLDGAPVGCSLESQRATVVTGPETSSTGFKIMLAKLFPKLISGFTERGIDCGQFVK